MPTQDGVAGAVATGEVETVHRSVRRATVPDLLPAGALGLLGLAVAWLALAASLATWTAAPTVAGWQPFVVMTDSMRPTIAAGDIVLVSRDTGADQRPLVPGDVALVADPDRPDGTRLHRYVRTDDEGRVVTKGDANAQEDAPSDPSQVVGRTRIVVPAIGLPVVWLHRGAVAPLAAVCVGTWLALMVVAGQRDGDPAVRRRPGRFAPAPPRHARATAARRTGPAAGGSPA